MADATSREVGRVERRWASLRARVAAVVDDHAVAVALGPPLLVLLAVFVYPVVWMASQSLFVTVPGSADRFAPLYNYGRMVTDPQFWRFARHSLVYSVGSLAVSGTAGFVVALAVNGVRRRALRTAYTTLLTLAWALPLAVVALTWKWIFVARPYGLFNRLLLDLGLVSSPVAVLADQTTALAAVTFVDGWLRIPFAMLLFLAGLQSIPEARYDAARVDGADTFQQFRAVTLPALRPYVGIVALINWMFAFRAFSIVYPMTQGGPGTGTTTLAVEIYDRGMVDLDFGYGSAMSMFLVAVTLALAVVYVRLALQQVRG